MLVPAMTYCSLTVVCCYSTLYRGSTKALPYKLTVK